METHQYTWGKDGAHYISINGKGEAYNLLCLVQAFDKRSKRGIIQVSNKPFKNSIQIDFIEGIQDRKHWHIDDWRYRKGFITGHISMPFTKYKAKRLYINVLPNGKAPYYVKPLKSKS